MKQYTLDNGIRVLLVPLVGLKSVTVQVFIKIGASMKALENMG